MHVDSSVHAWGIFKKALSRCLSPSLLPSPPRTRTHTHTHTKTPTHTHSYAHTTRIIFSIMAAVSVTAVVFPLLEGSSGRLSGSQWSVREQAPQVCQLPSSLPRPASLDPSQTKCQRKMTCPHLCVFVRERVCEHGCTRVEVCGGQACVCGCVCLVGVIVCVCVTEAVVTSGAITSLSSQEWSLCSQL